MLTSVGQRRMCFPVFKNKEGEPIFNRTVSANLGMSYSVSNVLVEAGLENVSPLGAV